MQITLDSAKTEALLPSHFREGRREASSNPKTGGEERGLLLPSRFQQSMDITFFGKICGKRMNSKGEKNYRKWCQNDQEGLKH